MGAALRPAGYSLRVSDSELNYPARVALISLRDRPENDTPQAIAAAPLGLIPEDIATGLRELRALGLARQVGGHWQLSDGQARHQPRRG